MPKVDLLRTQKNAVFQAIEEAGLSPVQFTWIWDGKDYSSSPYPVLQHEPSGYYFMFLTPDSSQDYWQFKCYPGRKHAADTDLYSEGWTRIFERVRMWAQDLKVEIDASDLWASAVRLDLSTLAYSVEDGTKPFTYAEVEVIRTGLAGLLKRSREIAKVVPEVNVKLEFIEGCITRLEQSAQETAPRVDWINQLVGLVLAIAVAAAFSPDKAREFFDFVKSLFTGNVLPFVP